MNFKLPNRILVLDLETENTDSRNPEKSTLLFVGIIPYVFHHGRYRAGKYKWFAPSHIGELERYLKQFRGLIIGHNILGFDYRVLRHVLDLSGIIEKTVDTWLFLYKKNGMRLNGTGLDSLGKGNLGRGKTFLKAKRLGHLWHHGQRKKVLEYNRNDCRLTQALWFKLVRDRSVYVRYSDTHDDCWFQDSIEVSDRDIEYLTGRKRLFSYRSWKEQIETKGYIVRIKDIIDFVWYWFYCHQCQKTFLFESTIVRPCRSKIRLNCPKCQEEFGEIRSELEYTLVGELGVNLGRGQARRCVPLPFKDIVLKHLRSTGRRDKSLLFIPRRNYDLDTDIVLHWFYCDRCKRALLFECKIVEATRAVNFNRCPRCSKKSRSIIISPSLDHVILIGEKEGIIDGSVENISRGSAPQEFLDIVSRHLQATSLRPQ